MIPEHLHFSLIKGLLLRVSNGGLKSITSLLVYCCKFSISGWHISSDDEWTALIDNLGGYDVAGGKMKESGTIHWRSPNVGATNESGFTALPSGFFNCSYGGFEAIYNTGYWWSSTKYLTDYVWIIRLSNYRIDVVRDFKTKKNGYPVRCVKD